MIEILPESEKNTIGLKVTGSISYEDIKQIEVRFIELIAQYEKINWLILLPEGFPRYTSLRAFYEDFMWAIKHLKQFDKMAIVGYGKVLKALIKADSLIFGEKYFDIADLDKAWQYVKSKPTCHS